VKGWLPFAGIAVLATLAGTSLFLAGRESAAPEPAPGAVEVTPAALLAARFVDAEGRPQSLAPFAGNVVILNFWATWCAPCREEMPGFVRLQTRWADRGVRFVGIANDESEKVAAFGRELGINYPLWVGGTEVMDLSRRLGNRLGVLPHSVILDPQGKVLETRIGPYAESALESRLAEIVVKSP
jgi:thiol-disulfide isomerase/thioredoxin